MRSLIKSVLTNAACAALLVVAGCGDNKGTGLLMLSIAGDGTLPTASASRIVFVLSNQVTRTYQGIFPLAGNTALVLEFPNLPANSSPVPITVRAESGANCVVASATKDVTIKAGEKTGAEILLARSGSVCSNIGQGREDGGSSSDADARGGTGGSAGSGSGGSAGSTSTAGTSGISTGGNSTGGSAGNISTAGRTGGSAGGSTGGNTGGSSTAGSTGGSSAGSSAGGSGGISAAAGSAGGTTLIGTTTFFKGAATGDLTGLGWVALGADDTLTSPTCGAGEYAITKATPCSTTANWSKDTALCLTGKVPALSATPTAAEYMNNWGVQVGVNTTTDPWGKLGKNFSSISFKFSGTPTSGIRAVLHVAGDRDDTTYCADYIKSGDVLDLTRFNTSCWGTDGRAFNASVGAKLDRVSLQISSTSYAITVTDFCLESITLR